ncbi:hypothetical protein SAMN05443665_100559 [Actinomadura meyerae]|jgi:hypothetical protein|uniref:PT repeat-containing protein n=1 Tax=Actinomadura meyerae TaxID=240840 RepID=A0A239EZS9_9ACTN|nr:hypothetical protein [Actinomadura meyerae]SNS49543.1 hypothetical protein SAMN05443665_100559 [Actinomadura meyerae]
MRPHTAARCALGALSAALLLSTAACGGGDQDKPGTADPMASFRACLEKQGVELPKGGPGGRPGGPGGPGGRPSGRPSDMPSGRPTGTPPTRPSGAPPSGRPNSSAKDQKAMQACASLAPQRGGGPERP